MSERALRRMKIYELIDLKVDYSFKKMFGSERNKNITIVFLNAILQRTGRNSIKDVFFSKQEVGGEYLRDKQSRLDIVVRTQADEIINIEIQLSNEHDMIKRTLFYWSHLYTKQIKKGEGYNQLVPSINHSYDNLFRKKRLLNI